MHNWPALLSFIFKIEFLTHQLWSRVGSSKRKMHGAFVGMGSERKRLEGNHLNGGSQYEITFVQFSIFLEK